MFSTNSQVILITGATDGFGKYVANKLAATPARVLLHGRNPQKMREVANSLQSQVPGSRVETFLADLSDLQQVARLASEIASNHKKLDVIINNAGVGFGAPGAKRELSADGFELRFAVNYLAPYLLTNRLLPLLKAAGEARIVNVASLGQAPLDFQNLMLEQGYNGMRAYGQSKLALIMATFDWAEELKSDHITANAIHPATYADTQMVDEAQVTPLSTVADGGEPIIALATSPNFADVTGQFFNQLSQTRANGQAYDPEARRELHEVTEKLLRSRLASTNHK